MKMLRSSGVEVGIITARTSQVVTKRMESLDIQHVYQGREDKLPAFEELLEKLQLSEAQVAYVGDDVVDLPIMRRVGLAITVQDGHKMAIQHAHWQTGSPGGRGAAREVCELLMEAQGTLQAALTRYLS